MYTSPPIVGATLEIRFAEPFNAAKLKKLSDKLVKRYDQAAEQMNVEAKIDFEARTAAFVESERFYRLSSGDQTDTCLINPLNYTWNRGAPYLGWEAFIDRIKKEFDTATKLLGYRRIIQLGLRYVNRIDVAINDEIPDYNDYFTFLVNAPTIVSGSGDMNWSANKEHKELGLWSLVHSGTVVPEISATRAFVFDIDVICNTDVPQNPVDIFEKFEQMRGLKNTIFEAGITPRTREKYN